MDTHAILCRLVEPLNCVAYGHILIKRVTEEVERMLTAVNMGRVFTQPLTLVLLCFIEAARTLLLNTLNHSVMAIDSHEDMIVHRVAIKSG